MNSLLDLRQTFENLGKEVTNFTGYSMEADGHLWGLLFESPVCDDVIMSKQEWKDYIKALKAGLPGPTPKPKKPIDNPLIEALGLGIIGDV